MDNVNLHFSIRWFTSGNTSTCGTCFLDCRKYEGDTLASWFSKVPVNNLSGTLTEANGFFSAVCIGKISGWIAVDKIRSYPVFYGQMDGKLFISDDANWVKEQVHDTEFDAVAKAEFLLAGFVVGSDTLYPNVKQVQAGEVILFSEAEDGSIILTPVRYYHYVHNDYFQDAEDILLQKLDQVMVETFNRLIEFADGRTIVVPLSGGYDSRLIAIMLKRLGYEKVITFTYGKVESEEARISRTIANALDFPWYFVEFTPEVWRGVHSSEEWISYFKMAGNLCSLPHIQDFIAIKELRNIIPSNSIFVPGIAADLNTGGFVNKYKEIYSSKATREKLISLIDSYSYSLLSDYQEFKSLKSSRQRIGHVLREVYKPKGEASSFEAWVAMEKVSKFVQNSVRAYEFWGYDWWTPFWDTDFINFWYKIEQPHRSGQVLYKKYIEKSTIDLGGLGLESPLSRDGQKQSTLKNILATVLPKPVLVRLRVKRWVASYQNHPFQWYSIVDKQTFIDKTQEGATCINSFLVEQYLDILSQEDETFHRELNQ